MILVERVSSENLFSAPFISQLVKIIRSELQKSLGAVGTPRATHNSESDRTAKGHWSASGRVASKRNFVLAKLASYRRPTANVSNWLDPIIEGLAQRQDWLRNLVFNLQVLGLHSLALANGCIRFTCKRQLMDWASSSWLAADRLLIERLQWILGRQATTLLV